MERGIWFKEMSQSSGFTYNLFYVGQLCDADLEVALENLHALLEIFRETTYLWDLCSRKTKFVKTTSLSIKASVDNSSKSSPWLMHLICFMAKASPTQAWLWHRRLSHLNFDTINLLLKNDIVNGLPKLKFVKDQLCSSWEMGKANRSSFNTKTVPSFKRRLHLLHMDLCGLMRVESINGKKYILVIVDDYSRYTWSLFLISKD
ncbi:retrovirus-related pol polyprotein from transposon TNT 1-94 [Tanacetum coccineum]